MFNPKVPQANMISKKLFSRGSIGKHKLIVGLDVGTHPVGKGISKGFDPVFEIGVGLMNQGSITGIYTFRDSSFDNSQEKLILEQFTNWLKGFPSGSIMVSYNGQAYDLPVLIMRSWQHGVPLLREMSRFAHFDVFRFLRKLNKEGRIKQIKDPSLGLKLMETFFGFKRMFKTRREGAQYLIEDVEGLLMITKGLVGG